tara:strand:+ start:9500 stop:10030 length:531 start_codon:yes stop_codon:yes gene_type:complete
VRTIRIDAVRRGRRAATAFAGGLLLAAAVYVAATPEQGKLQSPPVIALLGGLLVLAIAATINTNAARRGRGGLRIGADGIRHFTWWGGERFVPWDTVDHFDVQFIDPNDGPSREQAGFYLRAEGRPGRFIAFSGGLVLPNAEVVTILEHVRQLPPEARATLPKGLDALRAEAGRAI